MKIIKYIIAILALLPGFTFAELSDSFYIGFSSEPKINGIDADDAYSFGVNSKLSGSFFYDLEYIKSRWADNTLHINTYEAHIGMRNSISDIASMSVAIGAMNTETEINAGSEDDTEFSLKFGLELRDENFYALASFQYVDSTDILELNAGVILSKQIGLGMAFKEFEDDGIELRATSVEFRFMFD